MIWAFRQLFFLLNEINKEIDSVLDPPTKLSLPFDSVLDPPAIVTLLFDSAIKPCPSSSTVIRAVIALPITGRGLRSGYAAPKRVVFVSLAF
jgi:hypothetical protein